MAGEVGRVRSGNSVVEISESGSLLTLVGFLV